MITDGNKTGGVDHEVVAEHRGSQWESWIVVYADGRIVEHFENDGVTVLRRGLDAPERLITLEEVAPPDRAAVQEALQRLSTTKRPAL